LGGAKRNPTPIINGKTGPRISAISFGKTLVASSLVFTVTYLIQDDLVLALLLAGLAPASAQQLP